MGLDLIGQFKGLLAFFGVLGLFGYVLYRTGKARRTQEIEREHHEMVQRSQEVSKEVEDYVKSRTDSELDDLI